MMISDEFYTLVRAFHQDIDFEASNEEELITILLNHFNAKGKTALRAFLDELLSGNLSGPELQQTWRDCDPDWGFEDAEHLRVFLTMVRDRIPLS